MIQQYCLSSGERHQIAQVPKRIRQISIESRSGGEDSELQSEFNYATDMVSAKGLQIIGISMTEFKSQRKDICLISNEYCPVNGLVFQVSS